jgi:hypothetical protein
MTVHFVRGLIRVRIAGSQSKPRVICFKMCIEVNLDDILIAKGRQT